MELSVTEWIAYPIVFIVIIVAILAGYVIMHRRSPGQPINPDKGYFQRKIDEIISPQLESTYDDATIDEKNWKFGNFFQRIAYKILSLSGIARGDFAHDDITIRVYRRLLLRHSVLTAVEKLSSCHEIYQTGRLAPDDTEEENIILRDGILTKTALQSHSAKVYYDNSQPPSLNTTEFNKILNGDQPPDLNLLTQSTTHSVNASLGSASSDGDDESQAFILLPAKLRFYNLAVTDLFVEKALSYLNRKAKKYNFWASFLAGCAFFTILSGSVIAFFNSIDLNQQNNFMVNIFTKVAKEIFCNDHPLTNDNDVGKIQSSSFSINMESYKNGYESAYITLVNGQKAIPHNENGKTSGDKNDDHDIITDLSIATIINNSNLGPLSEEDLKVYNAYLKKLYEKYPNADKKEVAAALLNFIGSDRNTERWSTLISKFVKGFTFYGLLVLLAVFCYRMARALFDQAERLKDRRHALRQGRLFVHLNGGKMSVDELEKAFNWNMSSDNAFANINPDAQAPWGNVVKEMLRTIRETSKAGIKAAERK